MNDPRQQPSDETRDPNHSRQDVHRNLIDAAFRQVDEATPDSDSRSYATTENLPELPGYNVLGEIHRGGQGVVFKAVQKYTKRKVAIKVLLEGAYASQSARRRFEREIELVAQLKHPNIIGIFHSGRTPDGHQYCAMDYVRGQTLDKHVRDKKLSLEEALKLFTAVCDAVNYAHQKGVIHRDLKPSNILVGGDGVPKVLDFGLAKQSIKPEDSLVSMTGQVIGTLPYMSPEQARGNTDEIDTRTDLYSLGVVLYELLTGRYPYPVVGHMAEVLRHITETAPTPPSRNWKVDSGITQRTTRRFRSGDCPIDHELQTIVLKALSKERERRYQTASDLGRDIERYLAGEAIEARKDSALYVLRKSIRRYRGILTAGAIAVIALAVGLGIALVMYGRAENAREQEAEQRRIAESNEKRAKEERDKAERISEFMGDILQGVGPSVALGRDTEMLKAMLDEATKRIENGELSTSPGAELYLLNTLSEVYGELAMLEPARRLAERAMSLADRQGEGVRNRDDAVAMATLGNALVEHGEYDQAAELYEESLRILREVSGERHVDVATALTDLGSVSKRQGEYAKSETHYRDALAIYQEHFDDDDTRIAYTLNALAGAIRYQERYDEARLLYEKSLAIYRKEHGESHPAISEGLCNMARVFYAQSKLEDSERVFNEALAMQRRLYGEKHISIANTLNDVADVISARGQYPEAEKTYRAALDMRRELLGDDHPDVATTMGNLAVALERRGKLDEAIDLHRKSLAISRRHLDSDHHSIAVAIKNLADSLSRRGDYAEAEILIRESTAIRRKVFGAESATVATSQISLGILLQRQGKYAAAEAIYREALGIYRKALGHEHRFVASAMYSLCSALTAQEKLDEAETSCRESLAMRRRLLGEDHPYVLMTLRKLAEIHEKNESFAEAIATNRELLELHRRTKDENHPEVKKTLGTLARVEAKLKPTND